MKSIKLTKTKSTALLKAVSDIEKHIGVVADIWAQLTPEQRDKLMEHSPVLATFLSLARRFEGVL